jgi:outer membrane protein assembly factor BamB
VADVDGDGMMEILYKAHREYTPDPRSTGSLYCLDHEGNVKWELPLPMVQNLWTDGSPPTVADVTDDPGLEIIVQNSQFDYGKIFCVSSTGSLLWEYTWGYGTWPGQVAPCVSDLDGDGDVEIVATVDMDHDAADVLCLDHQGRLLWRTSGIYVASSPTAAELDGDAYLEIVLGSHDGVLYVLDGLTGSPVGSFDTGDYGFLYATPAVGDADRDGNPEIVFGSENGNLYCLDGATLSPEWVFATGDRIVASPALADIEAPTGPTGELEAVVTSYDGFLYVVDAYGQLVWSHRVGGPLGSSPAIAGIGCNGFGPEIIFGAKDGGTYAVVPVPVHLRFPGEER